MNSIWNMIKGWFIKAEVKGRMELAEELTDAAVAMFKEADEQLLESTSLMLSKAMENDEEIKRLQEDNERMAEIGKKNAELSKKLKEFIL